MAFTALNRVLSSLNHSSHGKPQQQFHQILDCWAEAVGSLVAAQTRPISVQRQVLQVATSTSTWAQTLMFERQRILQKLNPHLTKPLTDIRFSTAHWHGAKSAPLYSMETEVARIWQQHPSQVKDCQSTQSVPQPGDIQTPRTAFRQWAMQMQHRSQSLPLCPQCHCPTPEGELERWSVCGHCAAQTWSHQSKESGQES